MVNRTHARMRHVRRPSRPSAPPNAERVVKRVVGLNFDELVWRSKEPDQGAQDEVEVLLFLTAGWCDRCRAPARARL